MAKCLLIYPNEGNSLRIPLAISILSACLKENGHEVYIFDPTFFKTNYGKDYELMESRNVVKKTEFEKIIGELLQKDMRKELKKVINISKPDFVAISLIERNYVVFKNLLAIVKEEIPDVPVLVGGILPSISSDLVLGDQQVDYICIGEGEKLIVDFADKINDVEELRKIPNLWFKNGDSFIRNPLGPLTDLARIPFQDWSGFDRRQLLKPFEGKVYRGGSFEFSRGCYNICKFCVAPQLRGVYSASGKKYHRTKSPRKAVEEIAIKKDEYDLEINAFCDTNFLAAVPVPVLREFCELYKSEVGLPFMIQTGAETITEEKLKLIVDAGRVTISIGVESGSERIRKEVLNKKVGLSRVIKAFDLCRKYNLRTTANYMIGVPYETEDDVYETMRFNRILNPPSIAITYFQPFLGTELHDTCVKEGFYDGFNPNASVYLESPLKMPQLPPERIKELISEFTEDFNSWKTDSFGYE